MMSLYVLDVILAGVIELECLEIRSFNYEGYLNSSHCYRNISIYFMCTQSTPTNWHIGPLSHIIPLVHFTKAGKLLIIIQIVPSYSGVLPRKRKES
jgi:hypothetical protein